MEDFCGYVANTWLSLAGPIFQFNILDSIEMIRVIRDHH
jgi:hypothetical protein